MHKLRPAAAAILALISLTALSSPAVASPGGAKHDKAVCSRSTGRTAYCHARVVTRDDGVTPDASTTYTSGYRPVDLQSAYNLPSGTAGAGQTIAIVDAYDNPNAEADLATYRSQFALSPCTTANGCFRKVNQSGAAGPYPAGNTGWGQEIALDLDMASAICPNCHILLVEGTSNGYADLGAAENTAVRLGATVVSNSYGGGEFSAETSATYAAPYNHPGVAITVSSGDNGYGVEFPASSPSVTAVGGTHLTPSTTAARGWAETAWTGAGSGCSALVAKPAWQHDPACSRRAVADVSAVADPNTGVAVYDSYGSTGGANWLVFGGTSVAAPVVAGVYALAGNAASVNGGSYPYSHTAALNDITTGSNGTCTRGKNTAGKYLCTAGPGFDGPTGLGTPNGTAAF